MSGAGALHSGDVSTVQSLVPEPGRSRSCPLSLFSAVFASGASQVSVVSERCLLMSCGHFTGTECPSHLSRVSRAGDTERVVGRQLASGQ